MPSSLPKIYEPRAKHVCDSSIKFGFFSPKETYKIFSMKWNDF